MSIKLGRYYQQKYCTLSFTLTDWPTHRYTSQSSTHHPRGRQFLSTHTHNKFECYTCEERWETPCVCVLWIGIIMASVQQNVSLFITESNKKLLKRRVIMTMLTIRLLSYLLYYFSRSDSLTCYCARKIKLYKLKLFPRHCVWEIGKWKSVVRTSI